MKNKTITTGMPKSHCNCSTDTDNHNDAPHTIRIFLGGSFDPVHIGHLAILHHVYAALSDATKDSKLAKTQPKLYASFLPTARSPFKSRSTEAKHRQAMLALACQDTPFDVCDIEVTRPAPTYTIDTLRLLRERYAEDSLIFVLGADSAASLSLWRSGLQLTQYSHLWVLPRGEVNATPTTTTTNSVIVENDAIKKSAISDKKSTNLIKPTKSQTDLFLSLPKPLHSQVTKQLTDLKNTSYGHIYIDSTDIGSLVINGTFSHISAAEPDSVLQQKPVAMVLPIPTVSSSEIRASIASHNFDYAKRNLTPAVFDYIIANNLYTEY